MGTPGAPLRKEGGLSSAEDPKRRVELEWVVSNARVMRDRSRFQRKRARAALKEGERQRRRLLALWLSRPRPHLEGRLDRARRPAERLEAILAAMARGALRAETPHDWAMVRVIMRTLHRYERSITGELEAGGTVPAATQERTESHGKPS